jgi:hypothetical protein
MAPRATTAILAVQRDAPAVAREMALMKIVGRFVGRLLLCGLAAGLVVGCGGALLVGRALECGMNFGCTGSATVGWNLLAVIVVLAPLGIFAAGAWSLHASLGALGVGASTRAGAVVAFLLAPLLVIGGAVGLEELRVSAARTEYQAERARVARMAQAPIDVRIVRTALLSDDGTRATLSVTLRIANVPPEAGAFRFNLYETRQERGQNPFHLGGTFMFRYEGGEWVPYNYGQTDVFPHAGEELTLALEMIRLGPAATSTPPDAHVSMLLLDVRDNSLFFERTIPMPPPR